MQKYSGQKIKDFLVDLLFPKFCLGCNIEGTYLCEDCKAALDILQFSYCLCNKNPLRLPEAGKCGKCRSKKLSGLFYALSYQENPLTKKLIHQFKYPPYIKELSRPLSELIIEHFSLLNKGWQKVLENAVLIPVPLDKKKMKRRGFNQAEEIARNLSEILKIPLISNNLIKIKKTLPQVELSEKEREENIKNAFLCRNPEEIKKKKILLIDDVYTTGSTMEECARVLKTAGAKEVWGVAIAREE